MPEESDVPNENLYEQLKDQVNSFVQALLILIFVEFARSYKKNHFQ